MNPPDLITLLETLQAPATSSDIAVRFQCSRAALEGVLQQLLARGLVSLAEPGQGACASGCGMCSMQNFCPSSESSKDVGGSRSQVSVSAWRLTKLGERTIARSSDSVSGVSR